MKLDAELAQARPDKDTVLTVGVFDGVHRGHRHLISRVVSQAIERGFLSGVVTFSNHPASVLKPDFEPRYLTTLEERLRRLKDLGLDIVVPITFDIGVSQLRAREFVARLQQHLSLKSLCVGHDFAMGHKREGTPELLTQLGKEMGFSFSVVDPLTNGGAIINSTAIRASIAEGDMATVRRFSGRNFELTGRVVRGFGRGKDMGFPTANLEVRRGMAVPRDGIYATWAHVGGERHMAATSIGVSPTFKEGTHAIEAYFLDFDGEIYSEEVRLEFVERLRDEVKFESVEALVAQIDKDVEQTLAILRSASTTAGLG